MKSNNKMSHLISLHDAQKLTENFRAENEVKSPIGGMFEKESVLAVLNQPECVAMRYYFGIDDNNKKVLIIVGVDLQGNDMIDGIIIEKAFPCPPYCGDINSINRDLIENKRIAV